MFIDHSTELSDANLETMLVSLPNLQYLTLFMNYAPYDLEDTVNDIVARTAPQIQKLALALSRQDVRNGMS